MEVKMCPERIEQRVWEKYVKKEAQSRPKGGTGHIDGTNVGARGLPNGSKIHVQSDQSTCSSEVAKSKVAK